MNNEHIAKGTFETKLTPEAEDKQGDITFGRWTVDKKFQGDLEGIGRVEMTGLNTASGSGAYVAIERISGTLNGKTGTFVMMHSATRAPDTHELNITVVPGCSTGELTGLEGKLTINMVNKKHHYEFVYTL
jgi:hypothetical protein